MTCAECRHDIGNTTSDGVCVVCREREARRQARLIKDSIEEIKHRELMRRAAARVWR
jgi:hypothetical protein